MIPASTYRRLSAFGALFAVGFAVLGIRLVYVHVISPHNPDPAEDSMDRIARPARRGTLFSADEKVLAWSESRINIQTDPVVLGTNLSRIQTVANLIARTLGNATNGIRAENLIPLLTPHAETRRWSTVFTNRFESILDAKGRPRLDKANQPLVRPVRKSPVISQNTQDTHHGRRTHQPHRHHPGGPEHPHARVTEVSLTSMPNSNV